MGLVIGVPLAMAINTIVRNEDGIWAGIKEVWAKISLYLQTRGQKKRLDLYDLQSPDDLYKLTIKIPPIEEALEFKRPLLDPTETDNHLIYGGNSRGEKLLVRLSRSADGFVSSWLILRLHNGDEYRLPTENVHAEPKTSPDTFAGGRLKMKCLIPMRRWRITYNGFVRKTGTHENNSTHLKFSFLWTTSSSVLDLKDDLRREVVCKYLAKQQFWKFNINSMTKYLDCYVQVGCLKGNIQIGDQPETEINLWGARKRSFDICDSNSPISKKEYFAYTKDGEFLHYGQIQYPSHKNKLNYGFVIRQTSSGGAVRASRYNIRDNGVEEIIVTRGKFTNTFEIETNEQEWFKLDNGDLCKSNTALTFGSVRFNKDDLGHCLILEDKKNEIELSKNVSSRTNLLLSKNDETVSIVLVTKLNDTCCLATNLTGGKGSSLANLTTLSTLTQLPFSVPKGIVVTTNAYELFINETKVLKTIINAIEDITWVQKPCNLKEACELAVSEIENQSLPESISKQIEIKLNEIFGNNFKSRKFAVRSSASGEDSEDLSAAGQMSTFLGVQGLETIIKSVINCWASQFSFVAIQYKRQNGQILNSPMAVVIQEMVPSEVAGVMFSCDPVTGNPGQITITANYGIGESVVSATAEPDTIACYRNGNKLMGNVNVEIGKKESIVQMSDEIDCGGVSVTETDSQLANKCCLSDDNAIRLAKLGIMVEEAYGCPIDIEWAITSNQIHLLQARPITTLDKETDFDIVHELDSPIRSEEEYSSTANMGEVMPGAFSHLGMIILNKSFTLPQQKSKIKSNLFPLAPYYQTGGVRVQNQTLFSLFDSLLKFYQGEKSVVAESLMVATFGRILDDVEMLAKAAKRNKINKPTSGAMLLYHGIKDLITCNKMVIKGKEKYWNSVIDIRHCQSTAEAHSELWQQLLNMAEPFLIHSNCSMGSALTNLVLITILVNENKKWCTEVYSDFAYILSSCSDVESADVPQAIDELLTLISKSEHAEKFKKMSIENALKWLQQDSKFENQFAEFLKQHGHRCFKEFDVMSIPWGQNPKTLVKILQDNMATYSIKKNETKKTPLTLTETFRNMKTKLSWKNKLILRLVIPLCRRGVRLREKSKSLVIKMIDIQRKAYQQFGIMMVNEGRLPDPGLIFYLTPYEIDYLIKTRSPKLVQKTLKRRQLHPSIDCLIFPDFGRGFPKPINYETNIPSTDATLTMKGVPVSMGVVKGPARVAVSLEEAAKIQSGEILIAYSTDIGWSPYFPMLAGVATEIGGLVSHGAVVAREYGLPCVVALNGATLRFKTGDMVLLNGNKGILQRIEN